MANGQYYYGPHRNIWGVWKNVEYPDGGSIGEFIGSFHTKEEARNEVYKLNGWKK